MFNFILSTFIRIHRIYGLRLAVYVAWTIDFQTIEWWVNEVTKTNEIHLLSHIYMDRVSCNRNQCFKAYQSDFRLDFHFVI